MGAHNSAEKIDIPKSNFVCMMEFVIICKYHWLCLICYFYLYLLTSHNPFTNGLIIFVHLTHNGEEYTLVNPEPVFKCHTVHRSKPRSHIPHIDFSAFPCSLLHFCFVTMLHSCHTSSSHTLIMTPSLYYTAGHFRPPAHYNFVLQVVYATHR